MAIGVSFSGSYSSTSPTSPCIIAPAINLAGASLLVITLLYSAGAYGAPTSVTYGGSSMTLIPSSFSAADGNSQGTVAYYLNSPPSGVNDVVATGAYFGVVLVANIVAFTGTNTTTPIGAHARSSVTGSSPFALTMTGVVGPSSYLLMTELSGYSMGSSPTATSAFTLIAAPSAFSQWMVRSYGNSAPSTGSNTFTYTNSSDFYCDIIGIEILPSTSASPQPIGGASVDATFTLGAAIASYPTAPAITGAAISATYSGGLLSISYPQGVTPTAARAAYTPGSSQITHPASLPITSTEISATFSAGAVVASLPTAPQIGLGSLYDYLSVGPAEVAPPVGSVISAAASAIFLPGHAIVVSGEFVLAPSLAANYSTDQSVVSLPTALSVTGSPVAAGYARGDATVPPPIADVSAASVGGAYSAGAAGVAEALVVISDSVDATFSASPVNVAADAPDQVVAGALGATYGTGGAECDAGVLAAVVSLPIVGDYLPPIAVVYRPRMAKFVIRLSNPSATAITVAWATLDGTAIAPADYIAGSGVITIAPGAVPVPILVQVRDAHPGTPAVQFSVVLSIPGGCIFPVGATESAICIIYDPAIIVHPLTATYALGAASVFAAAIVVAPLTATYRPGAASVTGPGITAAAITDAHVLGAANVAVTPIVTVSIGVVASS